MLIKFVKDRPGHDFRYALNSNKLRKKLNWKPKIKLDQGIVKTVNWYINNQNYFKKISHKLFVKRLGNKFITMDINEIKELFSRTKKKYSELRRHL